MAKRLYVGNLVWEATDEDLQELFGQFGEVEFVQVMKDRETGRSRGFAFVQMPNDDEADQAIEGLDGTDFQGRNLRVNEARPRESRGREGGGNYQGRRGYGGGGFGGSGARRGDY